MKVEILKTNPFIEGWQPVPQTMEADGKKIFELTREEYAHLVENSRFYKVKSKKIFFDEAYKNYSTACSMEPQNREYTDAFNNLNNNASGGYRTSHEKGTGCSAC